MGCYVSQGVLVANGIPGDRGHSVAGNGNRKMLIHNVFIEFECVMIIYILQVR